MRLVAGVLAPVFISAIRYVSHDALAHSLDTCPIARRKDEAQYREYRTKRTERRNENPQVLSVSVVQ